MLKKCLTIYYYAACKIQQILLCSLLLLLSACAQLTQAPLTLSDFYYLQPVDHSVAEQTYLEQLSFTGQEQQLLTQIETNQDTINLVAMTFAGLPVMQAQWQYQKGLLAFDSSLFDKAVVLRIIRDIQLIKWPAAAIRKGLSADYRLVVTTNNTGVLTKDFYRDKQLVIRITVSAVDVTLSNHIENYQLVIKKVNGL